MSRLIRKATALAALMLVGMMLCSGCHYIPQDYRITVKLWGDWQNKDETICGPGSHHQCEYEVEVPLPSIGAAS